MNTISTDFSYFIEHDLNPFVLFSNKGSIIYLNYSAELFMSPGIKKELYELATTHATQSFGHRVAMMELSYASYEFYAINVIYSNDEEIAIQLYLRPRPRVADKESPEDYVLTDINLLLQANIEIFSIRYEGKLSLVTDYTMPHIQLHQNGFSLLLRKIFEQFLSSESLKIELTIKIGPKIIVNSKSHSVYLLKMISDQRDDSVDKIVKELAISYDIDVRFEELSAYVELPAIN
jgi:hypothetical protein